MSKVGVWHIQPGGPVKLRESGIDLEKHLEDWIESDPSLLQSGLVIVARQMVFDGGRLDLLALDPQGRWIIIEIKAGAVPCEAIGQAVTYAALLDRMPFATLEDRVDAYLRPHGSSLSKLLQERGIDHHTAEETRDIQFLLVGTRLGSGLDYVVNYLTNRHEFPISAIAFDVYETPTGERVLVRELTEADIPSPVSQSIKKPAASFEQLAAAAVKHGAGEIFRRLADAAARHGLHSRNYAASIMYSPQQNRTRMLFTVWVRGKKTWDGQNLRWPGRLRPVLPGQRG